MTLSVAARWRTTQRVAILAVAAMLAAATQEPRSASPAANASAPPVIDVAKSLDEAVFECFLAGEYQRAASMLREHLAEHPRDAAAHYNLACALSRLGQLDSAAAALFKAVECGFREFDHMTRDADLEPIRAHETYLAIVEAVARVERPRAAPARQLAQRAQTDWRERYGDETYRYERDDARRLLYAAALDKRTLARVRLMLAQQADHLAKTLFGDPLDDDVLIAIPAPSDADRLLMEERVGGSYVHGRRTLISRNIGGNLRHEFCHVMHHAHMDRLKQDHRLWVQEGLATLYEDYELAGEREIRFLPNERHNIVKGLARMERLASWSELFSMSDDEFMARAEQHYPQVRSIFEFLAAQGKLQAWYDGYIAHFAGDPDGVRAFEATFNEPIGDVEQRWRDWLRQRPLADLAVTRGDAALGIRADPQSLNDGVRIAHVLPGSAADGVLHVGDIITAVDGVPTPESSQLVALIASRDVGDRVNLTIRRDGEYADVRVTLRALGP